MDLFKKSSYIGVSITPESGLEVAVIDYVTKTVLKYGCKKIEFNATQKSIADMDIFKASLQDLFMELQIPKGSDVSISLPTTVFGINDYPAAIEDAQLNGVIEDAILTNPIFQDEEPAYSKAILPNSTIQSNKVAYTAVQKSFIYELCIIIKDLGCKIFSIDTSVNSLVNSLRYLGKVNTEGDTNWVLMVIEQYCYRIMLMIGDNYSDVFEENINIASVLGEDENFDIILTSVNPILKNLPAKYLYIVSNTDLISAEKLAGKISYSAPIAYQEANIFSSEAFISCSPEIAEETAKSISLNVIGTAIYKDFLPFACAKLNLYNRSLGEIYLNEQPPEVVVKDKIIVLSSDILIKAFLIVFTVVFIPVITTWCILNSSANKEQEQIDDLNTRIQEINRFLKENDKISAELFDEGDEIQAGLEHNRLIYQLYTIVGTEIPQKLWLTSLKLGNKFTIEGQADNLESIYGFFRSIKEFNPDSGVRLQKLGLATTGKTNGNFDTDSLLTSLNADFYDFRISNDAEIAITGDSKQNNKNNNNENSKNTEGK